MITLVFLENYFIISILVGGFGLDVLLYNHEGACPSDCMKVHPDEEYNSTRSECT